MAPLFLTLLLVVICAQAHECHKHYQSSLQETNKEKEILPAHASVNRDYNRKKIMAALDTVNRDYDRNKIMTAPASPNKDYNTPIRLVRIRRGFLYNVWDGILNNKSRENQTFFFTNKEMRRLKDFWMKDKKEKGWANQEWMDDYYKYWEGVQIPEDSAERRRNQTEGKKRNDTTLKGDESSKKTMQDEGKRQTKHQTVPNERTS
uniref:Uncharacterized protein n=1 Tax=Cacopsylla melanoneura TaxID=428564 RepID=A0A8D9E6C8_9HEMI